MTPAKKSAPDKKNVTTIGGDVVDSVIVTGDNNQTIIQKFFNIFKSDAETLERRNRRILLGHVENAWIKGVLDASLHGAALLDLGIKQDPEAVTQYPWAIKRESTDETLPAGTSMLEIFDSIGMGRSLLILGAPGSGKTTMLLELTRQLIERAREDVTYPIPMVFNLASWTEKLTLADWLAQELNNLYSVPRKTAPDWVKGNKLLLLLDGLDEVRQDSRIKCVEAINTFRKEHGLTSLTVCSRSQDYADLNTKLSFEGAIEIQPLTQEQIAEFFNRFGDEMAGINQALEKDSALREMAETPLFLSIMVIAYPDKRDVEILVSGDEKARRKHLFDNYIERMFERSEHSRDGKINKQNVLHWLSWLAQNMIARDLTRFLLEKLKRNWLSLYYQQLLHRLINTLPGVFVGFLSSVFLGGIIEEIIQDNWSEFQNLFKGELNRNAYWIALWVFVTSLYWWFSEAKISEKFKWSWRKVWSNELTLGLLFSLVGVLMWGLHGLVERLRSSPHIFLFLLLAIGVYGGIETGELETKTSPNQGIRQSIRNGIAVFLGVGFYAGLTYSFMFDLDWSIIGALAIATSFGFIYGGDFVIYHYALRFFLWRNNLLPWRLVPFLDHCVDLIFLRRVGGGYIFVHRLLMEYFAEMYTESE